MTANISTYALLAPLYYIGTRPTHTIEQFTRSSIWANEPGTRIIYIDPVTKHLHSIDMDGRNQATLVPHKVRDYLLSGDMKRCIFRGELNNLYHYDLLTRQVSMISRLADKYAMNQVAISPGGSRVAFLKSMGEHRPHKLMIYQTERDSLMETDFSTDKDIYDPIIAWSTREEMLYIKETNSSSATTVIVRENGITEKFRTENPDKLEINMDYGRNSSHKSYEGDDWSATFSNDRCGAREAIASKDLEVGLLISEYKKPILKYADNPGILHVGRRPTGDIQILQGCNDCIFDDYKSIYLLDINSKKIGKIVDGYRFITISDRYSKKPLFIDSSY